MEDSITRKWIEFITDVTYDEMPPEVINQTKNFILDNIGCALGGYAIDWGKKVVKAGCDLGGNNESTVIGSGDKLHCANAAYVNGKLSNVLDMDEVFYTTRHIGGVPLFPALSVGERVKSPGKDLILATALAYDFAARCAYCGSTFLPDPEKGVVVSEFGTMAFCTLSASIAAAKILKLDKKQIAGAITMAAHFAPGPIESKFAYTPPPTLTKYGDMGWFCLSGVIAALLAQNGYTGDPSILDGDRGLIRITGSLNFDFNTFIADLGTRWYIMDAGLKPYPTCRWFHTGIKLLEDIVRAHRLEPDEIEEISVYGHPLGVTLPTWVAGDKWFESEDKELWLSQFSFTYALACTVYNITPGPEWAYAKTLSDPRIPEMTKKITHGEHPEAMPAIKNWKGHPGRILCKTPTSIEVHSKKGTFSSESWDMPGDSWNENARLTEEEIKTKFRNNASHVLNDSEIIKAVDTVQNLEAVDNVTELMVQVSK